MPCGYHLPRICRCQGHPGHQRGISGCKHSGQPGYHILVTIPRSEGMVEWAGGVVLERDLYSGWPLARIFREYRKAYPHCDVEVTRLFAAPPVTTTGKDK